MILELHPKNPNPRDLKKVVEILQKDGVIIVPTDTIYAMACKLDSKKAIEKMFEAQKMMSETENLNVELNGQDLGFEVVEEVKNNIVIDEKNINIEK